MHTLLPRPIAKSTPGSWHRDGVCFVKLRAVSVGGKLHTCERWLFDFFEAITEARHRRRLGLPVLGESE